MLTSRFSDERGSLPFALLAVIIVTGLVTVVTSTTIAGQKQTRFDQGFEQSLQVAEIGLDSAVTLVASKTLSDADSPYEPCPAGGCTAAGGTYDVRAELDPAGYWVVSSTGTAADGTSRTVESKIGWKSVFNVAAFGKVFADFNGGNGADSYRSGTYNADKTVFTENKADELICKESGGGGYANPTLSSDSNVGMCTPTYKGVVATNGELRLKGNVWDETDYAEIHYAKEKIADPLPDATGYCKSQGTSCPTTFELSCDVREAPGVVPGTSVDRLQYCRDPLVVPNDPVTPPAGLTNQGVFDAQTLAPADNRMPPGPQLYTDVTLNAGTVIEGTAENPTVIYMTGTLTIPPLSNPDPTKRGIVNFQPGPNGTLIPRPAPSLLVFSSSQNGDAGLDFGGAASFAGAVHAPNAGFAGGSQGNVYGGIIALNINNTGGWNFHYDEALGDVTVHGTLVNSDWVER